MRCWRLDRLLWRIALLGLICVAGLSAAQPRPGGDVEIRLPPRRIDDVVRMLDYYQPDPATETRAKELADKTPPNDPGKEERLDFYRRRAAANARLGRIDQQIADLRQAVELSEPRTRDRAVLLGLLATAESIGGNMLDAARHSDEAIEQLPPENPSRLLALLQAAAHYHASLGDFAAARERVRRAEAVFARLRGKRSWEARSSLWTARIERARAEIFRIEGRLVDAEASYRKALAAYEENRRQEASASADGEKAERFDGILERSLASVLLAQGKLAEAELLARRALQQSLERVGRGATDTAQGLALLSSILSEQGGYAEATRLAEESLRSYLDSGAVDTTLNVVRARQSLGAALSAQGRYREALTTFQHNRELLKNDPVLLQKVGAGHVEWIISLLRSGNPAAAERMASTMLERSVQRYGEKDVRSALLQGLLGTALVERGESAAAIAIFRNCVPLLIGQARNDAESETGTARKQRYLILILEAYLRALAAAGNPSDAAIAESFRIADVARSSVVQQALTAAAARANIGDPELAAMARQEQDAQHQISALSTLLSELLAAPPAQQLGGIQENLRRDIARLKEQRDVLLRQLVGRFPEYAELVWPQPVSLDKARASLRAGDALLAFYLGERESYVWALDAQGRTNFSRLPVGRRQIAEQVGRLRRALDPGVVSIDELPDFDLAAAHAMYRQFLAPAAAVWQGANKLIVIPHGELAQLPLSLLPTAPSSIPLVAGERFAGYRDVPWLVRQLAIEQMPSAMALVSLRRLRERPIVDGSFAGFGDPLFSAQQAAANAAGDGGEERGIASRGARLGLRSRPAIGQVASAELAILPRLPDTGIEIREIAGVLHADPARDVFLQRDATEQRVLEMDLSNRRVLMFATHGLIPGDLDGLDQPALAMTSPAVAPGAGSGLLTMDEVLSLRLDADWVVLSACNTAAGEGAGAEAVSGLGRAFFFAGGRALLVSHWPVETVAARLLMTEMFRQQSASPTLGKAEALRRSMLSLIDGPGARDAATQRTLYTYAHPLFRAPFVVVGD